ncbi:MAG: 4Fe-4S binding protein [candidate division Zixibacteria bacterium]|nr:4Fe-4S binding protein [candidate division Zixibacteria bacterium]
MVFWAIVPFMLVLRRKWATRLVQLFLIVGSAIWLETMYSIIQIRLTYDQPWLRLVSILGTLSAITAGSAFLLQAKSIQEKLFANEKNSGAGLAAFLSTSLILWFAHYMVKTPILLLERFLPGFGSIEILLLAIYAGWITEKLLDVKQSAIWRRRVWLMFSILFFAQLILGLTGSEKLLMTGKLHLPIPALIIAGPLYRGGGFFMPILFVSTLILIGPAWCSYLCYIGSWDNEASRAKRKPNSLPEWSNSARIAILVVVPIIAILFKVLGASTLLSAVIAIVFGIIGVAIMMLWSRKSGTMTHCVSYCPIGLLADWLGKISPFRIRINNSCTDCGACSLACRYNALNATDIKKRYPAITCTLCGDCLTKCKENSMEYHFLGLEPNKARMVFVVMAASIHAAFMGLARM